MTTVYVTKWLFAKGILEWEALTDTGSADVKAQGRRRSDSHDEVCHFEYGEWARTRELAIVQAETMRKSGIASLEKQLTKLKSMTFQVEE